MNEPATPAQIAKKRCIVYIDGFNWYYGIFRHRPAWKWLNVQSYFETLRRGDNVVSVKLFTAIVSPNRRSEKRDRQIRYLTALRSQCTKLSVILGKFQGKFVNCQVSECASTCSREYFIHGEKQSDVNIAVNMMDDALNKRCEVMVLVSGDADLEPAVKWVREYNANIRIEVYVPTLSKEHLPPEIKYEERRNDSYHKLDIFPKPLPLDTMAVHQLPSPVNIGKRDPIHRPNEWV